MSELSRRSFIASSAALTIGAAARASEAPVRASEPDSTFPHQPADLVQAVVGASHAKFDKVKELVEKCPPLARASWDWGFGDWETALGAASHVGRRDIAAYLMSHGARPDIFTFAMLGDLDAVKALIKAQPGVQKILGPHGISLLQHAKNGGKESEAVAAYLESLGDAGGPTYPDQALTADQVQSYSGTYKLDSDIIFTIKENKGRLAFQRGEESQRFLTRLKEHEFFPVGSQEVRLSFDVQSGKALSITGKNHTADFKALRVE